MSTNENLTHNHDPDRTLANTAYTGGQLLPKASEFKNVLKRRKSRQSTRMPTNVDFDFMGGDVAKMKHLVREGKCDQVQLNFQLNLRRHA